MKKNVISHHIFKYTNCAPLLPMRNFFSMLWTSFQIHILMVLKLISQFASPLFHSFERRTFLPNLFIYYHHESFSIKQIDTKLIWWALSCSLNCCSSLQRLLIHYTIQQIVIQASQIKQLPFNIVMPGPNCVWSWNVYIISSN